MTRPFIGGPIHYMHICTILAKARSISTGQVAIARSISRDEVTAPIAGSTKLKDLEGAVGESLNNAFSSCQC